MNIYWDMDNHEYVKSLTSTQKVQSLDLILRDQIPITLHTVRPSTSSSAYYAEEDVPAGQSVIWGLKDDTKTGLDGAYLADQLTWTKIATGQYQATCNLNTVALIAALAALSTEIELDLMMEFTLIDVDGKHYDSTQMPVTVHVDVNRANEAEAVSAVAAINSICREELIGGQKVLILYNSDGIEYARFNPPGA